MSSRLALPGPRRTPEVRPWTVRATDLDVFGHVNNASHWPILEEVLAGPSFDRVGVAEIEYLVPVEPLTPVECRRPGERRRRVARRRGSRPHRGALGGPAATRRALVR